MNILEHNYYVSCRLIVPLYQDFDLLRQIHYKRNRFKKSAKNIHLSLLDLKMK